MKHEKAVVIFLLAVVLVVQLMIMKRIEKIEDGIDFLGSGSSKMYDRLNGRLYRIMDHFGISFDIIVDNPDGTTTVEGPPDLSAAD